MNDIVSDYDERTTITGRLTVSDSVDSYDESITTVGSSSSSTGGGREGGRGRDADVDVDDHENNDRLLHPRDPTSTTIVPDNVDRHENHQLDCEQLNDEVVMGTEDAVINDDGNDDKRDNGDEVRHSVETTTLKKYITTTLKEQQKQKLDEAMTMMLDEEIMLDMWISRLQNLQQTQLTPPPPSSFSRSSSTRWPKESRRVDGRSKKSNNDNSDNSDNDGWTPTATNDEQTEEEEEEVDEAFLDVTHDWLYVSASDVWNVIAQSRKKKVAGDADASSSSTSTTKFSAVVIKAPLGSQVQVSKPALDDLPSTLSSKKKEKSEAGERSTTTTAAAAAAPAAQESSERTSSYDQNPQRQLFVSTKDPKHRYDLFVETTTTTATTYRTDIIHETEGETKTGNNDNDEITRKTLFLGSPPSEKKRKSDNSSSSSTLVQHRYKKTKKEAVEVYVLTNYANTNEETNKGHRTSIRTSERSTNNKMMSTTSSCLIGMSKLFDDPMAETINQPEYTLSSPSASDAHNISCLRDDEAISSFF